MEPSLKGVKVKRGHKGRIRHLGVDWILFRVEALHGMVEEVNLVDNKIDGWRIVVSKEAGMNTLLGGARGIIVPHQFIKAIGDIVLINKNAIPVQPEEEIDLEEAELIEEEE